jgi:hypothetical protein
MASSGPCGQFIIYAGFHKPNDSQENSLVQDSEAMTETKRSDANRYFF